VEYLFLFNMVESRKKKFPIALNCSDKVIVPHAIAKKENQSGKRREFLPPHFLDGSITPPTPENDVGSGLNTKYSQMKLPLYVKFSSMDLFGNLSYREEQQPSSARRV
jgi:hypothetical protein